MADTGAIIAGGFRLLRERPLSVAVWGVVYTAANFGLMFALMPIMIGQTMNSGGPNFGMIGFIYLLEFLVACVSLVLFSAAFRAIYRPEESAGAYIRVGADEGRLIVQWLILAVLFIVLTIVSVLLFSILAGVVGATAGNSGAGVAVGLVLGLALFCFFIWLAVRLSLVLPVAALRRKVGLDVAWNATRGQFWSLFGAYLVLAIIQIALAVIAFLPVIGTFFAIIGSAMQNPESATALNPMAGLATGLGMMVYLGIAYVIVIGISIAMWGGATATAARELTGLSAEDLGALEEDFR